MGTVANPRQFWCDHGQVGRDHLEHLARELVTVGDVDGLPAVVRRDEGLGDGRALSGSGRPGAHELPHGLAVGDGVVHGEAERKAARDPRGLHGEHGRREHLGGEFRH
jgi:hypothetical protein